MLKLKHKLMGEEKVEELIDLPSPSHMWLIQHL